MVCDDGNPCNGVETCDPAAGCQNGTQLDCNDNLVCTNDLCDPAIGCVNAPIPNCCVSNGDCDDGDICNGLETCVNNTCVAGTPPDCDDHNPCTDDTCDAVMACVHTDNTNPCDDGNPCTVNDTSSGGQCQGGPAGNLGTECRAAAGDCDVAEACDGTNAACPADATKQSGTACTDDGNPCTTDTCDGTSTTCQHAAGNVGIECRAAAGDCDVAEACDGTYAACPADAKKASGTACTDDGNPCTAVFVTIGTLGYYGAYAVTIYLTVLGRFSIGALTFLAGSFRASRDLIQRILLSLSQVFEQSLYLSDLFTFFDVQPRVTSKPGARPVPVPIRRGFEFQDVGFRYPGSDRWAVRHLTFTFEPEERIALVGENGAGKTTLVKLLARLYDPDEGRILLDGVDLREYDLNSLRKNIGVIFQDFVRYDFVLKENIGVSQVEALEDDGRVREAARRSLADSVASRLAKGYDQMLGRRFDGGVELSGGEWQKVALGRAYMRDAQVLILDEPTASLDARAEYEVFLRFAELTKGRMAVLISHRFSTVRMADRILVLQGGELVDDGTHEELLARGGLYAELFSLQAAGYR